jgi:hypothetical protein
MFIGDKITDYMFYTVAAITVITQDIPHMGQTQRQSS